MPRKLLMLFALALISSGCPLSHGITAPEPVRHTDRDAGPPDAAAAVDAQPARPMDAEPERDESADASVELDAGSEPDVRPEADAGPEVEAGVDGAVSVLDPPELCEVVSVSDLPGVTLAIEPEDCEVSLEELADWVEFKYRITVKEALSGVVSNQRSSKTRCERPGPGGLATLEEFVFGESETTRWHIGRCFAVESEETLVPGTYEDTVSWDGTARYGGDAITRIEHAEPGPALLYVRSEGVRTVENRTLPFRVESQWRFLITP